MVEDFFDGMEALFGLNRSFFKFLGVVSPLIILGGVAFLWTFGG